MITFFDIPSTIPGNAWSVSTWKTRFSLNYKRLPYKTEWVEYPDIAAVLQKHNIGPTKHHPDGSPYYSLPAIVDTDDSTGEVKAALAESFLIAQYLDEAYPDTPKLLPGDSTEALAKVPQEVGQIIFPIYVLAFKATSLIIHENSRAHFSCARALNIYDLYHTETLEDIVLTPEGTAEIWAQVKRSFDSLDAKLGPEREWYLGDEISFADFVLGGIFIWFRTIFGEDGSEWTDIKGWNGGRWGRLLERLSPYQSVDQ